MGKRKARGEDPGLIAGFDISENSGRAQGVHHSPPCTKGYPLPPDDSSLSQEDSTAVTNHSSSVLERSYLPQNHSAPSESHSDMSLHHSLTVQDDSTALQHR
jgi:hypothetical protein